MRSSRRYPLWLGVLCGAAILAPWTSARAQQADGPAETRRDPGKLVPEVGEGDHIEELPDDLQGLEVVESLGAEVPRELAFRDETGATVLLGSYFDGGLPVLLTFNYSSCPMLCSVQLDALVQAMRKMSLEPGKQYQVLTVSVDPEETPEVAAETKERYVSRFPEAKRDHVREGWHFLTGDESAVQALADTVGFRYRHVARTGEYVHPATLIFLSPWGSVTRYFHGIGYVPEQLDSSIFQAGAGEQGVSIGFLLACFSHDPDANSHAKTGESVMLYGTIGFVVLILGGLGAWQLSRSRKGKSALAWDEALQSKRDKGNDA